MNEIELKQVNEAIQKANADHIALMEAKDENAYKANDRITELEKQYSELEVKANRKITVAGETKDSGYTTEQVEHKNAFINTLIRGKREAEYRTVESNTTMFKAMATDNNPQGGFFVPQIMQDGIINRVRDFDPIRQISSVNSISVGDAMQFAFEKEDPDWEAGWVGEREPREVTENAQIELITIAVHEMAAQPALTYRMLTDADFDTEGWISERIAEKFARLEGEAFINGDGNEKPRGLLQSERMQFDAGTLGTNGFDSLITLQAEIRAKFRANARWLFNRFTLAYLRTLKDNEGQYLWQPSLQVGDAARLLGDPYTISDSMPNAVDGSGALIVDNEPIIYGDFRSGYQIVDKSGMRVIRDEITDKRVIKHYTTTRTGGDVLNTQALVKFILE